MPRKPKVAKQVIQVLINGKPVAVTLHPPSGAKKSWYVYWPGLVATKSTGQTMLEDAIIAAEAMLKSGGKKPTLTEVLLSDEEFEAIQRAHFDRKKDTAARLRAMKTLKDCRDAISAFRDISKIQPISAATPDDCAAFQRTALTYPKNWRSKHPKSKEDVSTISANTVLKWSRSLQAAFDRASRNSGRKTVRGVVPEQRLLSVNPWKQFTWIEGHQRPIRQFDGTELVSFLDYLEQKFPSVTVATALARTLLWSWGRRTEIVGLRWDSLRVADAEFHFETVGKWGIDKWFRVPEGLYRDLLQLKCASPFVFAAYTEQLKTFHTRFGQRQNADLVVDFKPENLGYWFHQQLIGWSKAQSTTHASMHVFRKTSLQYARSGEDVNRAVAADARLSEGVMMTNYVKETDEQMRQKSNRMYRRILASLDGTVARRYGHIAVGHDPLKERIKSAMAAEDWVTAAALSAELAKRKPRGITG